MERQSSLGNTSSRHCVIDAFIQEIGLPREAMKATTGHYEKHSNMSSAGILHIIRSIQHQIEVDEAINLITMGAGFSVIYGCLRKVTP